MSGTGTASLEYVLVHETAHIIAPIADKLSSHFDLANAAFKVGRSMGLVPDAVPPPKTSARPGDAADRYNSALFDRTIYAACSPR